MEQQNTIASLEQALSIYRSIDNKKDVSVFAEKCQQKIKDLKLEEEKAAELNRQKQQRKKKTAIAALIGIAALIAVVLVIGFVKEALI